MIIQFNKFKIVLFFLTICNVLLFPSHFIFEKKIEINEISLFSKIKFHDKKIFAISEFSIFILDKSGKIINKFGQKGKGPGDFEHLIDFSLHKDKIYAADRNGKVIKYDLNGKFLDEYSIGKNLVNGIYKLENELFFYYNKWVVNKNKKKKEASQVINFATKQKTLFSIKDDSKINAYHPKSKGNYMFPWFPNPFSNRPVVLKLKDNKIGVFLTKKNYFYIYDKNNLKKTSFDFNLKEIIITDKDKELFFKTCELHSHKVFHPKTKKSVIFPRRKEYFLGVINWDDSVALLLEDRFLVVSNEGKLLRVIFYPEGKKYINFTEYNGKPEDIFIKNKDRLYLLNEENEIEIFKFIVK